MSATEGFDALGAILHTLEGISERDVFSAYRVEDEDLAAVLEETGTPVGWHPLTAQYDSLPSVPSELATSAKLLEPLSRAPVRDLSTQALNDMKYRLRTLYEAGPGVWATDEEVLSDAGENDEEESGGAVSGAHIPIPSETFLEELAQKLEIHPISVFWLLKELREQEGVVCLPELRRYVEDYFSVTILHLLGYRWPKQVEAGEPVPDWADPDGIVPLTEGAGEQTLLDRVRERIAADFGEARVDAIEQEFQQIMGQSLGDWLARAFFPHHVSQFKRRPIAWLLESGHAVDTRWEVAPGRRSGRRTTRAGGAAFSCLVYYHKLTSDTLNRVKTHYLRPVLQRREFELDAARRDAEQNAARRAAAEQLAEVVDELRAFEAALDTVSTKGFWSRRLEELLSDEEPDSWARRIPSAPVPDKDTFLRQEQGYDPDPNDGVRLNVAPLQKYGLLAADVLAKKDVEEAIADRAEWRSDERRWCREGKLPRPGWWADIP